MKFSSSIVFCLLAAVFPGSILSAGTISKKKADEFKKLYFPKIKKYSVRVECVSYEREFTAGTSPKMTFRLKNLSTKPLLVYEWFMRENLNLKIYYTPWTEHMRKPKKEDWLVIAPEIPPKAKRMPLQLDPGNSVYIDKLLTFISKLKLTEPSEFIVYAELNLTSIKKRSAYIKIKVIPPPIQPTP